MFRIDARTTVMVATQPADFRAGIDGLARLCQDILNADPRSGTLFVFRNKARTAVKLLAFDGEGYWLLLKRLSSGTFKWWPRDERMDRQQVTVAANDLALLLWNGNPGAPGPMWKRIAARPAKAGDTEVDAEVRSHGPERRARRYERTSTRSASRAS